MMSQMQLPFFRGRFRRPRVTCTDKIVGQLTLSSLHRWDKYTQGWLLHVILFTSVTDQAFHHYHIIGGYSISKVIVHRKISFTEYEFCAAFLSTQKLHPKGPLERHQSAAYSSYGQLSLKRENRERERDSVVSIKYYSTRSLENEKEYWYERISMIHMDRIFTRECRYTFYKRQG